MKPIRKAVFPVAGLGTRFLPATKAMPKEMLPIVDKPLIQYAVEEAVAAGVTELIFITGRNKRAIEDHFDSIPELEHELEGKNKLELLDAVQKHHSQPCQLYLHPPATCSGSGPCRAVRCPHCGQRALPGPAGGRPDRRHHTCIAATG